MAKGKTVATQEPTGEFDALALLQAAGIEVSEVLDASIEIGDGWHVIDKADLVGVPFVMVDYRFSESKDFRYVDETTGEMRGRQFLIAKCVTEEFMRSNGTEGKWIFVDGGTGVYKQIGEWIVKKQVDLKADKVPALVCKEGLIVSEYDYTDDKGNVSAAKTYYLP